MKPLRSDVPLLRCAAQIEVVRARERWRRRHALTGELEEPISIDLALWVGGACERLVKRDHVDDELRVEAHIRVEEQEVRGIGLEQKIAAFDDVRVGVSGKRRGPLALLQGAHLLNKLRT